MLASSSLISSCCFANINAINSYHECKRRYLRDNYIHMIYFDHFQQIIGNDDSLSSRYGVEFVYKLTAT